MSRSGQTFDLFAAAIAAVTPIADGDATKRLVTPAHSLQSPPTRLQLVPAAPIDVASSKPVTRFWLAIHLPRWSLNALQVQMVRPLPLVVIAAGSQQQVHACNEAAESFGIEPGMSLKAAYALNSEIHALNRDPQREQLELERLAEWAGRFTPRVSIEPPDGVLLEVKGSLRLFGGARALYERVFAELQDRGIHAQLSMAPTATAALCFARQPHAELCIVRSFEELRVRLASLPVTHLRWSAMTQQLLYSMGVYTVGDCQRLPRDGLARRIGAALLNELDQLVGLVPHARRHFVPRERFVTRFDFEMEVAEVARLEYGLQPMLEQLEQFLRTRQAAVQVFKLKLYAHARAQSDPMPPIVVRFAALAWTRAQMWTVLQERLSRVSLSAPVLSMRLYSSALMPLHEGIHCGDFFIRPADRDSQRALRLVERLRARLGEQAVYGLSLAADHRPELAWQKDPNPIFASDKTTQAESPSARPLWLLAPPQAMHVVQARPYYHGLVEFEQGPERIESGWWDGHDVTRDYYIVRSVIGQRLWIYRERQAPHTWFLHGLFS
jgi:protein ImuB